MNTPRNIAVCFCLATAILACDAEPEESFREVDVIASDADGPMSTVEFEVDGLRFHAEERPTPRGREVALRMSDESSVAVAYEYGEERLVLEASPLDADELVSIDPSQLADAERAALEFALDGDWDLPDGFRARHGWPSGGPIWGCETDCEADRLICEFINGTQGPDRPLTPCNLFYAVCISQCSGAGGGGVFW